eukprot:superscaffoldBa00000338_g3910
MSVQSFHLEDCPGAQELRYIREKAYFFPIEITNRVFTTALQNPESEEYKSMYEEVRNLGGTPNKNKAGFYAVNP